MNEICRRLWDRNLTVGKWAKLNNFSPRYTEAVIAGRRGRWNAGTAKKILNALVEQGFMTQEERVARTNGTGQAEVGK